MVDVITKHLNSRVPWFNRHIRFHLELDLPQVLEHTVGAATGVVAQLLIVKLKVSQSLGNGDREIGNPVCKLQDHLSMESGQRESVAT